MKATRAISTALILAGALVQATWAAKPAAKPAPKAPAPTVTEARVLHGPVFVATVTGAINPVTTEFVRDAMDEAKAGGAQLLVLQLDTPGGLDIAMRDIVQTLMNASIPTAVLVGPQGARAASAGTFITLAANIAAMSPGTSIGAASPVNLGGGEIDETMASKIKNDAVAYIKSIAEKRGRNVEWAASAVETAESISADKALELGVIDLVAETPRDLVLKIDGRELKVLGETVRLATKDVPIEEIEMGWRHRVLRALSDPNIAYMLMMLGFYGIFIEVMNPGLIFPGVFGAIALIVGLYSLQTLPIDYAGMLLILLGILFFVLEVKITSYGLLSVAGIASMTLGSLMLFKSPEPYLRASLWMIASFVGMSAALFIGLAYLGLKSQWRPVTTGAQGLVGRLARTEVALTPRGTVFVHGEIWSARAATDVPAGATVRVKEVRGLELIVEPAEEPPA